MAKFKKGDKVTTVFSGSVTHHVVIDIRDGQRSQSGVTVSVNPPIVKGDKSDAWLDSDWFKLVDNS